MTIYDGVAGLIAEYAPDAVVLEESFVGVDARTALSVGQARGAGGVIKPHEPLVFVVDLLSVD